MPTRLRSQALFLAGPVLLAACQPAGAPPGPPPPPAVSTITVEPRDLPVTYEYVGQTAGFREVEVRARVTGILLKRHYREGAPVKEGQSLFLIDPAPFQVALERSEADLAVAEARLAQARRDTARLAPAFEAKAVAQKDYDDAVSAERIAAAEVQAARARVAEARLNLEYTRVEAPISGVSGRAAVSEGTLVSGPAVLLTTVTQIDPMYVIFGIPDQERMAIQEEAESGRLKLPPHGRFQVGLTLADGRAYPHMGHLDFTDVRVNPQTGTSEARAQVPNPEGRLRAGEFVRVVLHGALRPQAVLVPQRAVLEGPAGKFVYVVNAEGKAEPRPVQVGPWNGDAWLIRQGLAAGERVIVDGVMRIRPGAPVKITTPQAEKRPAAPS
jgi:membrane fusion protein (multidrug efflux system)